jgi:signal peptidase I
MDYQNPRARAAGGPRERAKTALIAIVAALAVFSILRFFVVDLLIVRGRSMEPLFRSGQVVVVNRLAFGLRAAGARRYLLRWSIPERGEVLIVRPPGDGVLSIKWCAAVAGDPMPPGVSGVQIVPEEHVVVLGLNSRDSIDSRHFGPLHLSAVVARVLVVRDGAS